MGSSAETIESFEELIAVQRALSGLGYHLVYRLGHEDERAVLASLGDSVATAQFAVESIRGWWEHLGSVLYPEAKTLAITADCGGSNGYRTRLWKAELQRFAEETGLEISICHFGSASAPSTTPSPTSRSGASSAARSAPSRPSSTASPIWPPISRRPA